MYSPGSPTSWADTFPGTLPMPHVNTTADPRLLNTACDNVPSHIIYISHIGSSILHYHPFFSSILGQSRHRTALCFSCPQSPTTTSGKTRLRYPTNLRTWGPKDRRTLPSPLQPKRPFGTGIRLQSTEQRERRRTQQSELIFCIFKNHCQQLRALSGAIQEHRNNRSTTAQPTPARPRPAWKKGPH